MNVGDLVAIERDGIKYTAAIYSVRLQQVEVQGPHGCVRIPREILDIRYVHNDKFMYLEISPTRLAGRGFLG